MSFEEKLKLANEYKLREAIQFKTEEQAIMYFKMRHATIQFCKNHYRTNKVEYVKVCIGFNTVYANDLILAATRFEELFHNRPIDYPTLEWWERQKEYWL